MSHEDDDRLVESARSGDRLALEKLLEAHQARVYRFGLEMCRDPDAAEDVLQETLLAVARGIGGFRGASSISTWLYTIARSFCIKKRRRRKSAPAERSRVGEVEAERLPAATKGPDEALADKQIESALKQAIGELEPIYREVLLLRDVEGLTAPEVAQVVGTSVDAVKSRLHRARLAVRARVAPLLGIGAESAAPAGCPDVLGLFSRHLEDEISAEVCAQMERHLEACGHCRGACDSLRRSLALCRGAPAPSVPLAVQESVRAAVRGLLAG